MKNYLIFFILGFTSSLFAQVSNNALIIKQKGGSPGFSSEPSEVIFYGSGGLKGAVTGNGDNDNPATGSIGVSFIFNNESEINVGFTINKLKTTILRDSSDFGSNLILPDLDGMSFTLSGTHYFNSNFGLQGEILVANSKWELNSIEYGASPVSIKLGANIAPFNNLELGDNFVTLSFFAGYSNRSLIGAISQENDIRKQFFKTAKTSFHGLELGANLIINQTKLYMNVPILLAKDKISNLTGAQVNIGVIISGDVIKFKT